MLPNEDKVREWLLNSVTTYAIVVHSLAEAKRLWDIVCPFVKNDNFGRFTFFNYSKKGYAYFRPCSTELSGLIDYSVGSEPRLLKSYHRTPVEFEDFLNEVSGETAALSDFLFGGDTS